MSFTDSAHVCTCQPPHRPALLPTEGQRVCVTLVRDVQFWHGNERVSMPAGTVYFGTARGVRPDGFFQLGDEDNLGMTFYAYDSAFQLELLSGSH